MPTYANKTTVSPDASMDEIRRTLRRFGCEEFGFLTSPGRAQVVFSMNARQIKFTLTLPGKEDQEFQRTPARGFPRSPEAALEAWDQAVRQRWRALGLCIKAKLESIEAGIETFDESFLAHFVLPGGETVGDRVVPGLDEAWRGRELPPLIVTPSQRMLPARIELEP